jgi:hypothetical protein
VNRLWLDLRRRDETMRVKIGVKIVVKIGVKIVVKIGEDAASCCYFLSVIVARCCVEQTYADHHHDVKGRS